MSSDPFSGLREGWRTPGLVPGYELLNVLGSGGQGLVFKARKSAIGRTYAVKFLRPPDPAWPTSWHAAELEHLTTLAELRHPGIVSIEDRGEALGLVYLVLEFAGDCTLRNLLRAPSLDFELAHRLLDQTAEALQYLHARGVLHLDLKPSNVFVLEGRAKVGDFGLARLATATGPIDLTVPLGTPPYVAPEVVSSSRAAPASDVFALGRMLDDLLISVAARTASDPSPALVDLVNDATSLDPRRRPSLPSFRSRLRAARPSGPRRLVFRTLRQLGPPRPPARRRPRPVRFRP